MLTPSSRIKHFESEGMKPLRIIISGTAGTGKLFLIQCLVLLLQQQVRVLAPTGLAAFNVQGHTLHALLDLPTKGDFKELEGNRLLRLQQHLAKVNYLIINEMSMVGRKTFGQLDKRLRQAAMLRKCLEVARAYSSETLGNSPL